MWRSSARLLIGLFLLLGAGCCVVWAGFGWKYIWLKQSVVAGKRQPIPLLDPTFAKDPSIASAKTEVIGPLANVVKGKPIHDPSEIASVLSVDDSDNAAKNGDATEKTATQPDQGPPTAFNLVGPSGAQGPLRFRATFQLKTYRYFHLIIPAHATSPRVHGTFSAALAQSRKEELTDFLVLDRDQLKDLAQGEAPDAIFSHESSHGVVDVRLSPTILDAKDYYLVFSNPDKRTRIVSADLTASFDSE